MYFTVCRMRKGFFRVELHDSGDRTWIKSISKCIKCIKLFFFFFFYECTMSFNIHPKIILLNKTYCSLSTSVYLHFYAWRVIYTPWRHMRYFHYALFYLILIKKRTTCVMLRIWRSSCYTFCRIILFKNHLMKVHIKWFLMSDPLFAFRVDICFCFLFKL